MIQSTNTRNDGPCWNIILNIILKYISFLHGRQKEETSIYFHITNCCKYWSHWLGGEKRLMEIFFNSLRVVMMSKSCNNFLSVVSQCPNKLSLESANNHWHCSLSIGILLNYWPWHNQCLRIINERAMTFLVVIGIRSISVGTFSCKWPLTICE